MKIAIVGSGVSGLVTAYLLAPHHKISIFEKDSRIGGHAHTLTIKEQGKEIAVDNGFMVFNPEKYPHFVNLLKDLRVSSTETEMSFGVSIPGEISYEGKFPRGLFAQINNLWNLRFLRFLYGVILFKRIAKQILKEKKYRNETLSVFIRKHGISDDVVNWYLYPVLAAVWSIPNTKKVGDFPTHATLVFLNNHKLLDYIQPTWRTIIGGSKEYVSKIRQSIEGHGADIRLNNRITQITRNTSSVLITTNSKTEKFDYVIFATHADVTKNLLSDISAAENEALSKFSYSKNKVVLHKDLRYIPKNRNLLAAWNYIFINGKAVFTYSMNILQHIPFSTPVLVTLNPHEEIDKKNIYATEEYAHPIYNLQSLEGQALIETLQGKRRTYFTGAHLGYGFHEDGVTSAVTVANYFNILPPWKK